MIPLGTSDSGQRRGVRRYPYVIVPLDPPTTPIPDDAMYMEALVFALDQYPPEKVLSDYCQTNGLDLTKYVCRAVVFSEDLRKGKGGLFARSHGG